jgi:hypothetical protein
MSIYEARFYNFEAINENTKRAKLLNPLLIKCKAQCTTAPICNAGRELIWKGMTPTKIRQADFRSYLKINYLYDKN